MRRLLYILFICQVFLSLACSFSKSMYAAYPLTCCLFVGAIVMLKAERFEKKLLIIISALTVSSFLINNPKSLQGYDGKTVEVRGIIESVLESPRDYIKAVIRTDEINGEKIQVKLEAYLNEFAPEGTRGLFKGRVKQASQKTNPGMSDYSLYLKSGGFSALFYVDSFKTFEKDRALRVSSAANFIDSLMRNHLSDEHTQLVKSMLLGDSAYMEKTFLEKYSKLSISHIIAVSGLHISIVAGFVFAVLRTLGLKRRTSSFLALLSVTFYAFVIGFRPSIVRGLIMSVLFFAPSLTMRPLNNKNALPFCAILMLIINPLWVLRAGFWMSVCAAASISLLAPKLRSLMKSDTIFSNGAFSSALAVFIGLLPLNMQLFKKLYPAGIVANFLLIPLFSAILILSFAACAIGILSLKLASYAVFIIKIVFVPIDVVSDLLLNISLPVFTGPAGYLNIGIMYVILAMFTGLIAAGKRVKRIAYISLCLFLTGLFVKSFINTDLRIDFLDVAQGDCAIISDGKSVAMIDTGGSTYGNREVAKRYTLPMLDYMGVHKIDYLFISHYDSDHIEALNEIIREKKIGRIFASHSTENEYTKMIRENGKSIEILRRGDVFTTSIGQFKILHPDTIDVRDENARSLVILYEYGGKNVLFTGDAESEIEESISEDLDSVFALKVSHHGSDNSSSYRFLQKIKPLHAIISVGKNNSYGHPSKRVVSDLEKSGANIHRTDYDGTVSLVFGNEPEIRKFNDESKPFAVFLNIVMYCSISAAMSYLFMLIWRNENGLRQIYPYDEF